MRRIDSATKTSQLGPKRRDPKYNSFISKYSYGSHSNMFIEDFCSSYSIALAKHINERNFYNVDGDEKLFKSVFGYDFLRYDLDNLLSNITENLMLFGKAYVERIYIYDKKGDFAGVYYKCINCRKIKSRVKNIAYKIKTDENLKIKGQIPKRTIIFFRIKDLGFSKKFFRRKIKKLKRLELPKPELTFKSYFDIKHFEKKGDYRLLKITKDVYWTARKYDNTYVTEPYLIYRNMMFEKLRNNFLEYLISKINEDIDSIKDETKFTGKIIFDSITQNYDKLITEFQSGEKNCEQIGKVIFKGF